MSIVKLTDPSKTTDSPTDYETINNILSYLKGLHDVFISKHTTAGAHNDELLPKGRGRITYAGSVPTLAQSWGIVSSVSAITNGVRVTLSTASANTSGIHTDPTSNAPSDVPYFSPNSTTTVDIFFKDSVSEAASYPSSFTFAVWID